MEISTTKEEALAKRRAQNREAQRRFRWKQNQLKEKALLTALTHDDYNVASFNSSTAYAPDPDMLASLKRVAPGTKRPNGCLFSSLSNSGLFGNYALLDNFNMEDLAEDTPTSGITINPPSLLSHGESPLTADVSLLSSSQHPPSRSPQSSGGAMQTDFSDKITSHNTHSTHNTSMSHGNGYSSTDPSSMESRSRTEAVTNPDDCKQPGWQTPLHIAASRGYDRILRMLLQHKPDCNERDSDGLTPLSHASIGGHEHIAGLLLEHGARLGEKDSRGQTVFHLAVLHRQEGVLKTLLQHSTSNCALIDSYDNDGRTALHIAVDTGFEVGVRALLEHGVDFNCRARKT